MIKLTNAQALQFFSPRVQGILSDPENKFPIAAGHLLVVGLEKIRREFASLPKENDEIIKKFAIVGKEGQPEYKDPKDRAECMKELQELMAVEREVNIRKVAVTDTWPNLSISDIHILEPLLIFPEE